MPMHSDVYIAFCTYYLVNVYSNGFCHIQKKSVHTQKYTRYVYVFKKKKREEEEEKKNKHNFCVYTVKVELCVHTML